MKTVRLIMTAICLIALAVLGGGVVANSETKELSTVLEEQIRGKIDLSALEFVEKKSTPDIFASENAEKDLNVYKDANQTRYYFKETQEHGNVLCGIQQERYYATYVPGGEIIAEDTARQIAENYLEQYIENFDEYTFNSLIYNECDAVFVLSYYLPVQGFVSDDQIVIYITWDGEVGAFSAFNRYHFEHVPVLDTSEFQNSQGSVVGKAAENFAAGYGYSSKTYTVDQSILSARDGKYFVDQYVTVTTDEGMQAGTVIPVPIA